MLNTRRVLGAALLIGLAAVGTRADDTDEIAPRQKKRAVENWKRAFDNDAFQVVESQNFLFFTAKAADESKVRALAEKMDGFFNSMKKAMGLEGKKPIWPGKMTVYLLTEKRNMNSLIRSIEKRRPADVGLGSFYVKGEQVHVLACEPVAKDDPPLDQQVIGQLVQAAFTKFAGDGHGIPEWMMQGFIDATLWENSPKRDMEYKAVLALTKDKAAKSTKDLWTGTLAGKDLYLVRTSLADFLAYGPTQEKFPELLRAFKAEKGQSKPIDEVLSSIDQNQTKLNRHWLAWVRKGGKKE